MRYEDRTAQAVETLGGRQAVVAAMDDDPLWTNPVRTFETWMERRKIGRDGILFLWGLAIKSGKRVTPKDMAVIDVQ